MAAAKCGTPELPFPTEPEERWLPVVGWEGLYEVSDMGRVRSLDRVITMMHPSGRPMQRLFRGRVLRPGCQKVGRPYVILARDSKTWTRLVHQLVLEAFVGPRPEGCEGLHGPAGNYDNRLSNLSWGTHAKNCGPDMERDGTRVRGEAVPNSKLTEAKVAAIRQRFANGETTVALAVEYGVSNAAVHKVVKRASWAHVPMPQTA